MDTKHRKRRRYSLTDPGIFPPWIDLHARKRMCTIFFRTIFIHKSLTGSESSLQRSCGDAGEVSEDEKGDQLRRRDQHPGQCVIIPERIRSSGGAKRAGDHPKRPEMRFGEDIGSGHRPAGAGLRARAATRAGGLVLPGIRGGDREGDDGLSEGMRFAAEKLRKISPNIVFVAGCELTFFMKGLVDGKTSFDRMGTFMKPWRLLRSTLVKGSYNRRLNQFLSGAVLDIRESSMARSPTPRALGKKWTGPHSTWWGSTTIGMQGKRTPTGNGSKSTRGAANRWWSRSSAVARTRVQRKRGAMAGPYGSEQGPSPAQGAVYPGRGGPVKIRA